MDVWGAIFRCLFTSLLFDVLSGGDAEGRFQATKLSASSGNNGGCRRIVILTIAKAPVRHELYAKIQRQ